MAQLRQDYEKFVKLDTEILVAGPEGAEAFKILGERKAALCRPARSRTSCVEIVRPGGQDIQAGQNARADHHRQIRQVRFVHYGHSMMDIPENKELLELLATQIEK